MTNYMLIGTILKPQGVHGEAKVKIYASEPEDFLRWKTLYLLRDNNYLPVAAETSRIHDGCAYVTLEGCTTPEDVERLRDEGLYIDRANAAPLGEGQVYICDLIGCTVVDEVNLHIGVVTDVLQYGSVDVYVMKTPDGELMAPALKSVFTEVDVARKRVVVERERLDEVAVLAN